jgi:hypothetical protein
MAFFLDDILLAPCKFVTWIGRTLHDQAEGEVTDEGAIHERLLNLQTRLELEQIDEDEYIRQESALMRRLNEIHKYKERKTKGTRQ